MRFPLYQDEYLRVHVGTDFDFSRSFSECDEFGNTAFIPRNRIEAIFDGDINDWKGDFYQTRIDVDYDKFVTGYVVIINLVNMEA